MERHIRRCTVYVPGYGASTDMAFHPFYDENGVYHNHDGNTHGESWSCSNGHRWHRSWQSICPAPDCEWNVTRKDKITWDDESRRG
jgi:hypothetical protein